MEAWKIAGARIAGTRAREVARVSDSEVN